MSKASAAIAGMRDKFIGSQVVTAERMTPILPSP